MPSCHLSLWSFDETAQPESFDLITTFDAVHDQGQLLRLLKGTHRALKANGVYLMQDIAASSQVRNNLAYPLGTSLYTVSCMHCMTVSLAQGVRVWAPCGVRKRRAIIDKEPASARSKRIACHTTS
jgi:hypothetical protein